MSIYTSIRQNAIGLGLFAILTAGVIAFTQTMTSERIAENERHYQAKLLYEILPTADADLALLPQQLSQELFGDLALLGVKDGTAYFIDRSTQDVILPAIAPDGYTESIRLLVGISQNGQVKGVRVVSHKETPGLGDRIELKKSPWILQFDGVSISVPAEDAWLVVKDGGAFDQMSGATITPRAVIAAVHRALQFYQQHQAVLLGAQP